MAPPLRCIVLAALLAFGCVLVSGSRDPLSADVASFGAALAAQESLEAATDAELSPEDISLLQTGEAEQSTNPSYTLPYPAVTYAAHAAGGFFHPYSNVNPLQAPWAGFAPVAAPLHVASGAAIAGSPMSAYYAGGVHPYAHGLHGVHPFAHGVAPALGINSGLYPAAFHGHVDNAKGGYNVHGLAPGNVYGGYHPGLAADLKSLGGKSSDDESFLEAQAELEADADSDSFVVTDEAAQVELDSEADLDAAVADASNADSAIEVAVDGADAAFFETSADVNSVSDEQAAVEMASEADLDAAVADSADADSEIEVEGESDSESESDMDAQLLQVSEDDDRPEHPTYVLPYPPVLPGHYTPLFNPYTNVNPLSTPFANYAAQAGAHPGVAAAAAAQAGSLAAVNGQIAGAAGGYPYYPFAARHPVIAGQLTGNPVPFSGYAGWIHPQNLNSAAVGENSELAEGYPALVEVATALPAANCVGCTYN